MYTYNIAWFQDWLKSNFSIKIKHLKRCFGIVNQFQKIIVIILWVKPLICEFSLTLPSEPGQS